MESLVILLNPFAPHLSEEMWESLGNAPSLNQVAWPPYQSEVLQEDILTLVIQINGKLRSKVEIAPDTPEDEVKERALNNAKAKEYIAGKTIKKVIYVPKRLVNIVV